MTKTLIGALAALGMTVATAGVAVAGGDADPTNPTRGTQLDRQVGPQAGPQVGPGQFSNRRFGGNQVTPRFNNPGLNRGFGRKR